MRVSVEMDISDAIGDEWRAFQANVEDIDLASLAVYEGRTDDQLVALRERVAAAQHEVHALSLMLEWRPDAQPAEVDGVAS